MATMDDRLRPWLVTMLKMDDSGVDRRVERVLAGTEEQAKRVVELRMRADQRDAMGNSGWEFEDAIRAIEPGGSDEQEPG